MEKYRRNIGVILPSVLMVVVSLIFGVNSLFIHGPMGVYLKWQECQQMFIETALFFVAALFSLSLKKSKAGIFVVLLIFSWLHQMTVPMIVSFFYMVFLCRIGFYFRNSIQKNNSWHFSVILCDFIFGSAVWISLVCVISLFHIGGLRIWKMLFLMIAVSLVLLDFFRLRKDGKKYFGSLCCIAKKWSNTKCFNLAVAYIMTMFAVQIGRANVAIDYDSLHYGLRSAFILDNGNGIYENLGNINLVYTYSKGFEILTLPLNAKSYGYLLGFNLWLTLAAVLVVSKLAACVTDRYKTMAGMLTACFLVSIPGIMNMSITAKSDTITLLLQAIMMIACVMFANDTEDKLLYFILSGSSCLLSYIFKPTALVFSTILFISEMIFIICCKRFSLQGNKKFWIFTIPVWCSFVLVSMRTIKLTGMPFTSVFTGIFEKIGFRVKYPFSFLSISGNSDVSISEKITRFFSRIVHMLFSPVGQDMNHVIIAWGGSLIPFLMVILIIIVVRKRKNITFSQKMLLCGFGMLSIFCMISIFLLAQVDGNYFMSFYMLVTVLAVSYLMGNCSRQLQKAVIVCIAPLILFNLVVTCCSNWSGHIGFTPGKLLHRGYYDHRSEIKAAMTERGNEAIWNILEADPRTRVLAIGEHPTVLQFPCNVQSYYDVTGSGGNVWLVKTLDNFKDFLRYAKTDYIYIQNEYMEKGSRVWDIVRYMIEDGSLTDLRYEYGNMIAKINLNSDGDENCQKNLEDFYKNYQTAPL